MNWLLTSSRYPLNSFSVAGVIKILETIEKAFNFWNKAEGIASIGEMALTQAALESVDMQIEAAAARFVRNRDDRSVLADAKRNEQYLANQLASHTSMADFINTDFGTSKMVKARQSLWAREIYLTLRFIQAMDMLPSTSPKPWSERKRSLLRQRNSYVAMAIQFEGIVRQKTKELQATREFQAKIVSIAMGGDVSDADLQILQMDMDEQEVDAVSAQSVISRFALLANAANKTVSNIDRIITAGDKKHGSRK